MLSTHMNALEWLKVIGAASRDRTSDFVIFSHALVPAELPRRKPPNEDSILKLDGKRAVWNRPFNVFYGDGAISISYRGL